jgi:hypothetical protein
MEKIIKIKSDLFQQETTYIICEKLSEFKDKNLVNSKVEEANELLRNLKMPLPK